VWDVTSGLSVRTLLEHPYMRAPAVWSGDGRRIGVAMCDDPGFGPPAQVWDAESGELIFSAPATRCGQSVDLDHTGRLLAVQTLSADENIQVWDVDSGVQILSATHLPAWIGAVAFSPDGTQLLTGGADGTALIWDVAGENLVRTLTGHAGAVEDATWTSDGSTVVTGSHDGTARLWDATTGETLMVLGGHGTFPYVAVSPDGRYLASGVDTMVQVWALDLSELIGIAETRVSRSLNAAECIAYHFETCPTTP